MVDQADERLKVLQASMKEALGKLTGSFELEAQGVRERSAATATAATKKVAPRAKAAARPAAKAGPKRRSP